MQILKFVDFISNLQWWALNINELRNWIFQSFSFVLNSLVVRLQTFPNEMNLKPFFWYKLSICSSKSAGTTHTHTHETRYIRKSILFYLLISKSIAFKFHSNSFPTETLLHFTIVYSVPLLTWLSTLHACLTYFVRLTIPFDFDEMTTWWYNPYRPRDERNDMCSRIESKKQKQNSVEHWEKWGGGQNSNNKKDHRKQTKANSVWGNFEISKRKYVFHLMSSSSSFSFRLCSILNFISKPLKGTCTQKKKKYLEKKHLSSSQTNFDLQFCCHFGLVVRCSVQHFLLELSNVQVISSLFFSTVCSAHSDCVYLSCFMFYVSCSMFHAGAH